MVCLGPSASYSLQCMTVAASFGVECLYKCFRGQKLIRWISLLLIYTRACTLQYNGRLCSPKIKLSNILVCFCSECRILALPHPSLATYRQCIELESNLAMAGDDKCIANARKLYDSALSIYKDNVGLWQEYLSLEMKVKFLDYISDLNRC